MSLSELAWIDTHCHLDAPEFSGYDTLRADLVARADAAGVCCRVIPAVAQNNFIRVQQLAHQTPWDVYTLGIHPLYVMQAQPEDLLTLRQHVSAALADPKFVGIGEIGLDFFVQGIDAARQTYFYTEQLKIAHEFNLPVLLHVRRSQDQLLKSLRRIRVPGGIAHAFNGSVQQAEHFIGLGFALGFGGAMTYTRALQIRRLAAELPLHALVMETDAPDIPPAWLGRNPSEQTEEQAERQLQRIDQLNAPHHLPRMAETMAALRHISLAEVAQHTTRNALRVLPRLGQLLLSSGASHAQQAMGMPWLG